MTVSLNQSFVLCIREFTQEQDGEAQLVFVPQCPWIMGLASDTPLPFWGGSARQPVSVLQGGWRCGETWERFRHNIESCLSLGLDNTRRTESENSCKLWCLIQSFLLAQTSWEHHPPHPHHPLLRTSARHGLHFISRHDLTALEFKKKKKKWDWNEFAEHMVLWKPWPEILAQQQRLYLQLSPCLAGTLLVLMSSYSLQVLLACEDRFTAINCGQIRASAVQVTTSGRRLRGCKSRFRELRRAQERNPGRLHGLFTVQNVEMWEIYKGCQVTC